MAEGREKGRKAESDVICLIADHLGVRMKRNLVQTRDKGGYDLMVDPGDLNNPIAKTLDRFAIEIKNYRRVGDAQVKRWWYEAVAQAQAHDRVPVLFYRGLRQDWRIMTPMNMRNSWDVVYTMTLFIDGWAMLVREVSE